MTLEPLLLGESRQKTAYRGKLRTHLYFYFGRKIVGVQKHLHVEIIKASLFAAVNRTLHHSAARWPQNHKASAVTPREGALISNL